MRTLFFSVVVVCVASVATLGGCKPEFITGTSVEDSPENRKVLEFLTRYQQGMQNRSVDDVVKLCASEYFEDNGNSDPKDDYNVDGLRTKLGEHFKMIKELSLEVYVQTVDRSEDDVVAVVYRYNTRALVGFASGDKWLTATEVNKIKMRALPDDEVGFRILSGL